MNNFEEDYDFAEKGQHEPFWDAVYKKAFTNMTNHMPGKKELCNSQKLGIDRIIYLENGKTITIDEKLRRETWKDVALEFISNDVSGTPGWMEKDLAIDYLAYAFLPEKKAYLFNWIMLKRAWNHYNLKWKKDYPIIKAENKFYNTHCVCVPIRILLQACSDATIIQLP